MELFAENRIVLDLCGGTGSWSEPYRNAGYDVRVIDLDPVVGTGGMTQDVRLFEVPEWLSKIHGILAAPECTHLAASGARWWGEKGDAALIQALSVADACLRIVWLCRKTLAWWALENPVGRLPRFYGPPEMYFQPCDYGDPYTKKTGIWGEFRFPQQNSVEPVEGSKMHKIPPSEERWRLRSMTPQGFATAFFQANP